MNKKILAMVMLAVVLTATGIFLKIGQSKTKSYYSGDAIYFHNQLVVGTTNSGYLETFKLQNGKLVNLTRMQAPVDGQMRSDSYSDMVFSQEGESLYVYASSGRTLYKYDFSDLTNLALVNSSVDTTFDWFGHLAKVNNQIITSGTKAVKIWNYDLQVIDSFKITNTTNPYNVSVSDNGRFIFNITHEGVEVYDRNARQVMRTLPLTFNLATGNHALYFDSGDSMLYAVDDAKLVKMDLDGSVYKTYEHSSQFSYDVVASTDSRYVYSDNGRGVAKVRKNDLGLVADFLSYKFKVPNSWVMGMKVVPTDTDEMVVVFNNSNIVVLNSNLKPVATLISTEEDVNPQANESLFLKADRGAGNIGDTISINGGGFQPEEDINVLFAGTNYTVKADTTGRFATNVTVPVSATNKNIVDIKATGVNSNRTYSMSFRIIQ